MTDITCCTKCGGTIYGDVSNCYCKDKTLSWREKYEKAEKRIAELDEEKAEREKYVAELESFYKQNQNRNHEDSLKVIELEAEIRTQRDTIAQYQDKTMQLEARLKAAQDCVDRQAECHGLWFTAATAPEALLQHALRELHEVIEGKTKVECVNDVLRKELLEDIGQKGER